MCLIQRILHLLLNIQWKKYMSSQIDTCQQFWALLYSALEFGTEAISTKAYFLEWSDLVQSISCSYFTEWKEIPVPISCPFELVHNDTQKCWTYFSSIQRFLSHASHKQIYVVCKKDSYICYTSNKLYLCSATFQSWQVCQKNKYAVEVKLHL